MMKQPIGYIVRSLLVAYLLTGILLVGLAFSMYKFGLSEKMVDIGITAIYLVANIVGGILIGKGMKNKKFLWGFLVGLLYVVMILLMSIVHNKGVHVISADGLSTLLLCIGGGTIGGMIS